jgi:2-hydroxyglutarate dehydrogenase
MSCDVDITIIGAGIIGLAVASEVARENLNVFILEKNENFGRETSSRNSGVIHSGLLSPRDSFNAKLCIEGKHLIYEICEKYYVDHRKTGKLLIARSKEEEETLEALFLRNNKTIEMERISKSTLQKIEPEVRGESAILLPDAGIVDAHGLMRCFLGLSKNKGANLICRSEVIAIENIYDYYRITLCGQPEGISYLTTRIIINCAGLQSDKIARMAGIDIDNSGYKLNYFKGEYYTINSNKGEKIDRHLVYPMLRSDGLIGIHTVLDIDGRVRLGPDFYPVDKIDYAIDDSRKQIFISGIQGLFPFIKYEDIDPESCGIMPRLYSKEQPFTNFIIRHEQDRGLAGFINLVGIESPGLTASPAIGRYVGNIIKDILAF